MTVDINKINGPITLSVDLNGDMCICNNGIESYICKCNESHENIINKINDKFEYKKIYYEKCIDCKIQKLCSTAKKCFGICPFMEKDVIDKYYCKVSMGLYEKISDIISDILLMRIVHPVLQKDVEKILMKSLPIVF